MRVEALLAAGRMQPAGLAVIERARAGGSWEALDEVETLVIPDDQRSALQAQPPALGRFEAFPPSYRRNTLAWISAAKRPETRATRVARTNDMAAQKLRTNHARQPMGQGG